VAEPVSVMIDTFGTGSVPDEKLSTCVREIFALKPSDIIKTLELRRPIYQYTAKYGHFGVSGRPWERTDKVGAIQAYLGKFKFAW